MTIENFKNREDTRTAKTTISIVSSISPGAE